ncbi:MAG: FoF1 ATP synthase subunit a [Patescibacteria group bacterium]|nr:FoF1 ATP synthase subunit a [Patescibacteria group bacterium]
MTNQEDQHIQHEITLFAEPIGEIGNFVVTNSYLNSLLAVLILVLFFVAAGKKIKKVPKGIQNFFEIILEGTLKFSDSITADRKKSEKFLPLVLGLFLFILVNNWLGIIPGIGTIGFVENHDGHNIFVPLFRGATADLNTTLALALVTVIASHVLGIMMIGAWNHINRFINLQSLLDIPKEFGKDKSVILVNPIKAFVGLIEIVGEIAKIASLAFRLFGNIFAGEVLLVSMMALFAFLLPIPFIFLEVLVGFIQALVFSILILVFFTMSTVHEH